MARYKKARRAVRRVYSSVKSSYRRSRKPSISAMDVLVAGAVYGIARPTIANALPTMFAFGPVDSDNVILGAGGYMASKSKTKLFKTIGLIAMGTESGIVASKMLSNQTTPMVSDY